MWKLRIFWRTWWEALPKNIQFNSASWALPILLSTKHFLRPIEAVQYPTTNIQYLAMKVRPSPSTQFSQLLMRARSRESPWQSSNCNGHTKSQTKHRTQWPSNSIQRNKNRKKGNLQKSKIKESKWRIWPRQEFWSTKTTQETSDSRTSLHYLKRGLIRRIYNTPLTKVTSVLDKACKRRMRSRPQSIQRCPNIVTKC